MTQIMEHEQNGYGIGTLVVYRSSGIYRIEDIRRENFFNMEERLYYVMRSVYDNNSIVYLPTDAKEIDKNIRCILSREEIGEVIRRVAEICEGDDDWIDDVKARSEYYERLLAAGECCDILRIFRSLFLYRDEIAQNRKKLYASDAKILGAAEKIITEEFSFVLGIAKDEVVSYVFDKLTEYRGAAE